MTVVDVGWLEMIADVAGAKVEVDAEGGVVVSPAADPHVVAATQLAVQIGVQLPGHLAPVVEGPRWSPLGELGPSYVPDFAIVERRSMHRDDHRLAPPPLLVVEILSPSTRRRDLGEKADGYHRGGATAYWTIEMPGLADVEQPLLHARTRELDGWVDAMHAGRVVLSVGGLRLHVDLDDLTI